MSDASNDNESAEHVLKSKAGRLAVAGTVAPYVREGASAAAKRRVARVDKDGNVVGYTTLAEVQRALLERKRIEIAVQDGVRPAEAICERCGNPTKVRQKARVEGGVTRCNRCTFLKCADCGKDLPRNYSSPSMRARAGGDVCCLPCRKQRTISALPECTDCSVKIGRNLEWQFRRNHGNELLRCGPCRRKWVGLKPRPKCVGCSKELPRASLSSPRAKAGRPPMCRDCYSGETRAQIARAKIADDPAFAEKVKRAMAMGHARNNAKRRRAS